MGRVENRHEAPPLGIPFWRIFAILSLFGVGILFSWDFTLGAGKETRPADPSTLSENLSPSGGPDIHKAIFDRLKNLSGTWRARSTKGWDEEVTYEVIARGSVVVGENRFRGFPDRTMLTMFHMDRNRLMVTHYCEARNQPRLVLTSVENGGKRATFSFLDGTNLSSRDQGHMDQAVIEFIDDDHFSSRWTWFQDGKETWLEDIVLERIPRTGSDSG